MQFTIRKLMLLVLSASVFGAICVASIRFLPESPRPRIAVRNSGHQTLTATKITLTSPVDGKQQVIDISALSPDQTVEQTLEISGDPKLKIEYTYQGSALEHTNDYIDLWPSDTWLIEIGDDGKCTERYWTDRPAKNNGD